MTRPSNDSRLEAIAEEAVRHVIRKRFWEEMAKLQERDGPIGSPGNRRRRAKSTAEHTTTAKQGQFLAFIYYYTKLNRQPPAEADMAAYFHLSPPSVHQMVLTLEKGKLIERTPGQPRSIRLLVERKDIPDLE